MLPVLTVLARSPTLAGPADIACLALRSVGAVATSGHQRRRGGRAIAAILGSVAVAGIGVTTAADRRAIGGRAAVAAVDRAIAVAGVGVATAAHHIAGGWHAFRRASGDFVTGSAIDRATAAAVDLAAFPFFAEVLANDLFLIGIFASDIRTAAIPANA